MPTTAPNKNVPLSHRTEHKRYRSACDLCHRGKVKCAGGNPCQSCEKLGVACYYSISNRIGRPKGAKNKKTLDRLNRVQQQEFHGPNDSEHPKTTRRKSTLSGTKERPGIPFSSIPESGSQPFSEVLPIQGQGHASDDSTCLNSTETFWSMLHCMGPELGPSDSAKLDSNLLATLGSFNPHALTPAPNFVSTHETTLPRAFEPASVGSASGVPTTQSNMISDFRNTDNFPFLSASSNSMPPAACDCLQRQAELLSRLKILNKQHAYLRIDSVMIAMRHAFDSWQRLLKCTVCHQDGGREVLLLSVMGIRTILHDLKAVCARDQDGSNVSDENNEWSAQRASNGHGHDVQSNIGDYELTGEEKLLVTDTLLYSALGNIKSVLSRIKERIERANMDFQQSIVTVPTSRRVSLSAFPLSSHGGFDSSYISPGRDQREVTTDGESSYDSGYLMQLLQGAEDAIESLTAQSDTARFLIEKGRRTCSKRRWSGWRL